MQHACARHGQDLLLQTARRDKSAEVIFNSLRDGRIDGLIVHNSQEDPLVQRLAHSALVRPETAIPVVAIADPDPVLPVVTCEDSLGMELLVHELLRRGYTRFAFLEPQFKLSSVESRKLAWKNTLLAAGVLENALLNIEIDGESAESALRDDRLLTGERCAVSCWNDQSAYSLLSTCFRHAISVPGDLAITGFDGLLDPRLTDRRLVTVDCRWADAASTAVDLLMQLISGEAVPEETRMPVFLTLGDTI